jgi:hypothetical protein
VEEQGTAEMEEETEALHGAASTRVREAAQYPPGLGPEDGGWDDPPAHHMGVFFTTADYQQYAVRCKPQQPPPLRPPPETTTSGGVRAPRTPAASVVAEAGAPTTTDHVDDEDADDGTSAPAGDSATACAAGKPYRRRYPQLKYCHGYAEKGSCRNEGACAYPHLTYAQVQQAAKSASLPRWAHRAVSTAKRAHREKAAAVAAIQNRSQKRRAPSDSQPGADKPCHAFTNSGFCRRGLMCPYSHSVCTPRAAALPAAEQTKRAKAKAAGVVDVYASELANYLVGIGKRNSEAKAKATAAATVGVSAAIPL